MYCVDFAENILFRRYSVICLIADSDLSKIPILLDTITNGLVYEMLARSNGYLN